ncbi:YcjF family protein [Poseidonocella sedimentorum]|uniref:Putative membrane protein n=1 Tax=Poseidonocella sedimentorum TaxID=871652 RepID=A0A1I6EQ30_9RHOB|nr:TIGR01620 family protein [Poseidonocella sedimentorum]SFR19896.1 putative membrane protein [Poseidonocella sedimentorum]
MTERKGPVLIDLESGEDRPAPSPADAPPVPDPLEAPRPEGQAMQVLATLGARRRSRLVTWFWGLAAALLSAWISVAAWDFITELLTRNEVLGIGVGVLALALLLVCLMIIGRELAAFARLGRVDALHREAEAVLAEEDLGRARDLGRKLVGFYAHRDDLAWGRRAFSERVDEQFDVAAVIGLAEQDLLSTLDAGAEAEIRAAARQVATVTALVPLAFADVAAAATANMRMIRRIAEIYGGRSGGLSTWRLTRSVLTHLVATGAVAVGDDLLEPVLGGSLLGKVSRRFGEGLVNGALTVRVGIAAMEVCRPLPFVTTKRPSVRQLVRSALTGIVTERS